MVEALEGLGFDLLVNSLVLEHAGERLYFTGL